MTEIERDNHKLALDSMTDARAAEQTAALQRDEQKELLRQKSIEAEAAKGEAKGHSRLLEYQERDNKRQRTDQERDERRHNEALQANREDEAMRAKASAEAASAQAAERLSLAQLANQQQQQRQQPQAYPPLHEQQQWHQQQQWQQQRQQWQQQQQAQQQQLSLEGPTPGNHFATRQFNSGSYDMLRAQNFGVQHHHHHYQQHQQQQQQVFWPTPAQQDQYRADPSLAVRTWLFWFVANTTHSTGPCDSVGKIRAGPGAHALRLRDDNAQPRRRSLEADTAIIAATDMRELADKWKSLKACRDQLRHSDNHVAADHLEESIAEVEILLGIRRV